MHTLGEGGELVAGLAPSPTNPLLDKLAAYRVVADLLRADLFGIEQDAERLVRAVPGGERPGLLDRMTDLTLNRHRRGVEIGTEVNRDLNVAEIHRGSDPMDRHVRRPERRPQVVAIVAEPLRGGV